MARNTKPQLAVVKEQPTAHGLPVPKGLGTIGAGLWTEITANYAFDDPASMETLRQGCAATERAEMCAEQIRKDGVMIRAKGGVRSHPLLRDEATFRALACRLLQRLGLDLEPLRSGPGRPPGLA